LLSIDTVPGKQELQGPWETLRKKIKELYMVKGDSKKPRGKMSSWIFFVQTFRRTGSSQGFILLLRVSKEYSEMWETMSCKDKGKLGDMPKQTRLIMKEK
jgi:hypothetical protein